MDFRPIITRISEILPLSVVTADKGYDSEDNHLLVRESLHAFSVIPARYEHVPIWRTRGKYRKQMKRGYSRLLYNQRNKDETIISVIKRLFGEHITSRLVRTQNRELSFRCIAYNTHRLTNLTIITWFLQSPNFQYLLIMRVCTFIRYYVYFINFGFILFQKFSAPKKSNLLLVPRPTIYVTTSSAAH